LDILQLWNLRVDETGRPCIVDGDGVMCKHGKHRHIEEQLNELQNLNDERKMKWPEIRTLVASIKGVSLANLVMISALGARR
jgi:hypothetical protein